MSSTGVRRAVLTGVLAVGMAFTGTATATAEPYTNQFTGEGSSSFGFAWEYARWSARADAVDDGFTDPNNQCTEIFAWGDIFWARVVWECTREV